MTRRRGSTARGGTSEIYRSSGLRVEAEKILAERGLKGMPPVEAERLVQELQVHQIELEMQNEELRRAQSELAASREKYVDLYDFAPVSYFSFDPNGIITDLNLTATSLIGVERTRLVGTPFFLYLDPRHRDIFFAHCRTTRNSDQVERCELVIRRKDSSFVSVSMESMALPDKTGNIRSALIDITKRTRLEEEASRLAAIVASSDDAIIGKSLDGIVVSWNAGAERLYGYSSAEAVGRSISFLFPPGSREDLPLMLARIKRGEHIRHLETTRRRKDGTIADVSLTISPIWNPGGKIIGVATIAQDIGERKRIEEALRKSHDQLEISVRERTAELQDAYDRLVKQTAERDRLEGELRQAHKLEAIGTLAGGIAHDFNNMLAAIIGFTELVMGHVNRESQDGHYLGKVMEAGIRGRDLVRQMLTFSRKTELETKPLRLSTIVTETVEFLRASTPATVDIRVATISESGSVLGDTTQIQQVIMNLATNAVHAMRQEGGVLDIELGDFNVTAFDGPAGMKPGPYMKLSVRDTGSGMPPDIMDKIFDPFFTTKAPGEGTGLGLSVVHGIVKQHGGYITATSEPGKGSAFAVYFPEVAEEAAVDAASDDEIPTGSERILFVDDEKSLVEIGEDVLDELGYIVTSRVNGHEALALIKEDPSRFDLVITDQTMPGMSGLDLAEEVLALRRDMPIVLCTGFSHAVDAKAAKQAGIKAFAMKPFTKRELAKTIRKVLDE